MLSIKARALIGSGGPQVHSIGALRSRSNTSILATSPASKINCVGLSLTREKLKGSIGFNRRDDSKGLIFPSYLWKAENIIL